MHYQDLGFYKEGCTLLETLSALWCLLKMETSLKYIKTKLSSGHFVEDDSENDDHDFEGDKMKKCQIMNAILGENATSK